MKIVVLDGNGLNPGDLSWECLGKFGEYTVYPVTETEELAAERLQGCDIALTNKTPITASLLEKCPSVRYIGVQATGYNVVDVEAAKQRGIPVTNVPSYGTAAVAQFTMALLLEVCHRIGYHDALVHEGEWVKSPTFCFWRTPQSELAGKTIGIIGFGRIGRAAGALAKAFGMRVLAYSRSTCPEGEQIGTYVSLEQLLARSDVISLHCPLFPETNQIINAASIAKMKDGAILLNTSRGGLINEQDVADALASGKLRAAAVDVVVQEPMAANNPLLTAPNCIITPHIAWAPIESRQRLLDTVVDNIRCFLEGNPQNVVNR